MSFVAEAASMMAHPPPLDCRRVSTDTDLEMPAVFTLLNIHLVVTGNMSVSPGARALGTRGLGPAPGQLQLPAPVLLASWRPPGNS